ncbi:MAG: hypothetical protein ACP5QI_05535 [Candidatus Bathyarchaeia archaeon]
MNDEDFIGEALKIVEAAERRGITLRILGALAIRLHSGEHSRLHVGLERLGTDKSFTDIDLIAYGKERHKVRALMEDDLGFKISPQTLLMHGKERLIYWHTEGLYHVDVFFDKLRFSHDIDFGDEPKNGRLSIDYPTIPLAELLLEKLQIHDITEKDIKDVIVLLRAHRLAERDEEEALNMKYVSRVLADDWGFWYDAVQNLRKVGEYLGKYLEKSVISREDAMDVASKIERLLHDIDAEPKTSKWVKRMREGPDKKWWRDVEEFSR